MVLSGGGWDVAPSGTWCRHSFATNLSHAGGVLKEYIQEAMGHSVMSGTIIDRYIRSYPIDQQMQFNSKLLKVGNQVDMFLKYRGNRDFDRKNIGGIGVIVSIVG